MALAVANKDRGDHANVCSMSERDGDRSEVRIPAVLRMALARNKHRSTCPIPQTGSCIGPVSTCEPEQHLKWRPGEGFEGSWMLCRSFVFGVLVSGSARQKFQTLSGIYKEVINKESKTSGFCGFRVIVGLRAFFGLFGMSCGIQRSVRSQVPDPEAARKV